MNREILFRGKRKSDGEWIFGNLLRTDDDGICIIQNHVPHHFLKNYEVDQETVCQYTGLTDNNGRKIFENDVVAYMDTYSTDNGYAESDCVGKVLWCEEELYFYVTERLSAESWEVLEDCYVIGNIFDNSELLDKESELDGKS